MVQAEVLLGLVSGIAAVIYSIYLAFSITKLPSGNKKMQEISQAIRTGAMAYLKRQYKTVGTFAIILFLVFLGLGYFVSSSWYFTGISFAVGAILTALAGFIGMHITTLANVRTTEAAKNGLSKAMNVAFKAGSVMGFAVVGLGLLGVTGMFYFYSIILLPNEILQAIIGMGFGASLVALFARVGGGIFTKGADVGADLVGKIEKGIPEDDPRNPAVIADNVGDNVGDCAGMGSDLFESYIVTIIATMLLGQVIIGNAGVLFPIAIASIAIMATIVGSFFVKLGKSHNVMGALNKGIMVSAVLAAVIFYFASQRIPLRDGINPFGVFISSITGLMVALLIVWISDYYTSTKHKPVKEIADSSQTGAGTNVISGLAVGFESTALPAIVIAVGILIAFYSAGIFGIAVASLAMVSITGIMVAIDTFGPVTDNAGGIAEMAGLDKSVRKVTDELDAVGNTTKATTKGFAIGSAGLAALALLLAFAQESRLPMDLNGIPIVNIMDVRVLVGLLLGAMLPFLFSSFCMKAVGVTAKQIVHEVRRQFREIKGLMEGTGKPDYAKCVDISTQTALKELMKPGLLTVGSALIIGFTFGPLGLAGLLVGSLITGLMLAIYMSIAGGAWDNAKKYIEQGHFGGKGSEVHKAAVVGDTVGDPFKDTAGPSLNSLIKVLNTLAIVIAPLIIQYNLVTWLHLV
ncbi:MAG: sodium-translocating pyrophosphatase [Candidatus Diapherotrites archaeon]|nr:sodium-translocating pyrophosphatase [Candidatus Diapherotrites archaeon]